MSVYLRSVSVAGKLFCIGSVLTANPRRAADMGWVCPRAPEMAQGSAAESRTQSKLLSTPRTKDCLLHSFPLTLIQFLGLEVMFESSSWENVGRPLHESLRTEGQGCAVPAPRTSQMAPKHPQKEPGRVCPGDIPGKSTQIKQPGLIWVDQNSTVKPEQVSVSWPNCSC